MDIERNPGARSKIKVKNGERFVGAAAPHPAYGSSG